MSKLNIFIILFIPLVFLTGFYHKEKKVLIIGDSISIGYTPFVRSYFENKAIVKHNPGNAQHTAKGLANIKEWVGDEKWDIIQINWGLWDMCYRNPDSENQGHRDKVNGKITFDPHIYRAQLDSIVSIIENTSKAKIIFVTTSYVPTNEAGRYSEDVIVYNKVAKEVMKKHGVVVNDIYERSIPIHNRYGKGDDNVHYTKEGYEKLSKLIIDFLDNEI